MIVAEVRQDTDLLRLTHSLCPCDATIPVWFKGHSRLDIGVGTNCVIYNYTFISKIKHTSCSIHIRQSSIIISQTMIDLLDIRYAQNYILDLDVM